MAGCIRDLSVSVCLAFAFGCALRDPSPLDARRYPVIKAIPPLGTGAELLQAEILPPEKFFGKRFHPPGVENEKNPIPRKVLDQLERRLSLELSAGMTLGRAVEALTRDNDMPLDVDGGVKGRKLPTAIMMSYAPAGDWLYWLARLTRTRLVLRRNRLIFAQDVPIEDDEELREHDLPSKAPQAGGREAV